MNQHVKGWQNNVMDHHYSRYMYLLRSVSEAGPESDPQSSQVESNDR